MRYAYITGTARRNIDRVLPKHSASCTRTESIGQLALIDHDQAILTLSPQNPNRSNDHLHNFTCIFIIDSCRTEAEEFSEMGDGSKTDQEEMSKENENANCGKRIQIFKRRFNYVQC